MSAGDYLGTRGEISLGQLALPNLNCLTSSPYQSGEVDVVVPIFQKWKLRLREVQSLTEATQPLSARAKIYVGFKALCCFFPVCAQMMWK